MKEFKRRSDVLSYVRQLAQNPKGKFVSDFDDTSNTLSHVLLPQLNALSGKSHSYADWNDYDWVRFWGLPMEEISELLQRHVVSGLFYEMPLQKDFDAVAIKLGMTAVVTSRPQWYGPRIRGYMAMKGLPQFMDIECCNSHEDVHLIRHKEDVCRERGARVIFEDAAHHVIRCAQNGIVAMMMNHPWNENVNDLPVNVIRFRSYEEVGDLLKL